MFRLLKWWLGGAVVLVVALSVAVLVWLHRPLSMAQTEGDVLDLVIEPGNSARMVARKLVAAGVTSSETALFLWFRLSGQAQAIKAGSYEVAAGTTPRGLLEKLVRGEQAVRRVTLVEGWNYRQVLQALRSAESLQYDLPADAKAIAQAVGLSVPHLEGRFFPDTYVYTKNATASGVLRQAASAMNKKLNEVWAQRDPAVPLRSAEEALILASIVEKETGLSDDRDQIAGVFANRLRIGMRLQTDPTVIYGLGPGFDGRLRRRHLDTDNPYNTYTRAGLPPTPIAMPGLPSLQAAVRPASTPALYFVARGDGSSHFSRSLDEHNAAVRRYILNR